MKRLLTILSMAFIGLALWADNDKPQMSRKEIYIIHSTQCNKIMRDLSSSVNAYINYETGFLELECYGVGDANVYVVDSNNQTVEQMIVFDGTHAAFIPMPEESGNYVLVIWSNNYYGEGIFTI